MHHLGSVGAPKAPQKQAKDRISCRSWSGLLFLPLLVVLVLPLLVGLAFLAALGCTCLAALGFAFLAALGFAFLAALLLLL